MGRPTTGVYEVSAPDGEVLGVARASSAGQALRRVNELCGVPCTVLGRRVFFAEQHRRACAGRWQVRSVRLSVKAATLLTRNYVPDGPTAVFVAPSPRRPNPGLIPEQSESENVMRPSHSSTDLGISLSKMFSGVGGAARPPAQRRSSS